jgi:predicted O-methyltransferase YrrM
MDYKFSNSWFLSNNIKASFDKLINFININNKITIIEIGSFEGQSTSYFLNNYIKHPNSILYALDTFEGSIEHNNEEKKSLLNKFKYNIELTNKSNQVKIMQNKSLFSLSQLVLQNIKADLIYIDGSHTASNVLTDAVLAWQCCKIGGFIVFDDYLWKGYDSIHNNPKLGIDNFINTFYDKILMDTGWTSYQQIIKKIKE